MSGETVKMILILSQLIISVITDLYYYKVKNLMIIIFLAAGAAFHIFSPGQQNMLIVILGLITPFAVLLPFYILKMLGAGDIKLFCSIGLLLGVQDILFSIMYSYLVGLVLAVGIMLSRDNFTARFKKLFIYLKSCILSMSILPYDGLNTQSDGKMHFTIPIAIGTIAVILF
jgi:prepilin peptidase CpaA